jgi:hypothetical protein
MKRKYLIAGTGLVAAVASLFLPFGGGIAESTPGPVAKAPDFADLSADKPEKPLNLLFVHHSCGGQLLAAEGGEKGASCIYDSHPSGGGLRATLQGQGYAVHEASYDSEIGGDTDLFDWLPKFSTKMDRLLRVKRQNELLPEGTTNQVVVFKSCFPNNQFAGEGEGPGSTTGPQLTVANAKATLKALLPLFEKHPETLFVYVTAPPIAPKPEKLPLHRVLARALKGRTEPAWTAQQARWARSFNDWVVGSDGWLKDYKPKNVVVFDYYGVLTGEGKSNLLVYPSGDGSDSHPTADGNRAAAKAFVPLLNRAVRRAGLTGQAKSALNAESN